MQVLVNDFLSDPMSLQRGVRQGDALSPLLYVLCVEVLACKIRATCDIKGFLLLGQAACNSKYPNMRMIRPSLLKTRALCLHFLR